MASTSWLGHLGLCQKTEKLWLSGFYSPKQQQRMDSLGQASGLAVTLEAWIPNQRVQGWVPASAPHSRPWKTSWDCSSSWIPAAHVGDLRWVLDSWPWHGPVTAVACIRLWTRGREICFFWFPKQQNFLKKKSYTLEKISVHLCNIPKPFLHIKIIWFQM